jgi:hypothetical protein
VAADQWAHCVPVGSFVGPFSQPQTGAAADLSRKVVPGQRHHGRA